MKKWLIIMGIAVVLIVVAYPLFFRNKKETPKDSATFTSQDVVKRGGLSIAVSATGKIEPIKTVELRSKASGEIIRMLVEEGDFVRKDQIICELEKTRAQNDYAQAQAALEVAKVNL